MTGAQFVRDTFTGNSGVLLEAHTGQTGAVWRKRVGPLDSTAVLTLDGASGAVTTATSSATFWYTSATPTSADYQVSVDVTPGASGGDTEAGPTLRCDPNSHRVQYALVPTTGAFALVRWNFGGTILGSVTLSGGAVASETYRLTIDAAGSTIRGRVQRLSTLDYLTSAGAWTVSESWCVTVTDTVLTAAGRAGLTTGGDTANVGTRLSNYRAGTDLTDADPATGASWRTLTSISREHREWAQDARLRGLEACPYDGQPLTTGAPQAPAVRHCPFCGRGFA